MEPLDIKLMMRDYHHNIELLESHRLELEAQDEEIQRLNAVILLQSSTPIRPLTTTNDLCVDEFEHERMCLYAKIATIQKDAESEHETHKIIIDSLERKQRLTLDTLRIDFETILAGIDQEIGVLKSETLALKQERDHVQGLLETQNKREMDRDVINLALKRDHAHSNVLLNQKIRDLEQLLKFVHQY